MAGKDTPLQTPYDNPAMPTPGNDGDLGTSRGLDPNVTPGGASGLQDFWTQDQTVQTPSEMETANSVSGLPLEPTRFQPSETPPSPPDLTDRNPGTIDQR